MITVESMANAILDNEGYSVYVGHLTTIQGVAIEPGQFVRVDFGNAGEMEIQCQRGSSTAYLW
jgi:hypothetical protein